MPRDGSGQYTLPQPPFVAGTILSSSAVNSDFSDIAAALTASVARDGQAAMQGALNMGNYRITNLAAPSVTTDAARLAEINTRLPLAGGTMTGAIAMGANKITGLGAPTAASTDAATAAYADAAPANKLVHLYDVQTPGTDLPVGTGAAVTYADILLPDGVADFHISGLLYVQQTAAAANTAKIKILQLDSGLSTLQTWDFVGLATVAGVDLVAAPFVLAGASTNVNGSRLRIQGYKDSANGPFNLVRLHTAGFAVAR